jgi:putative ABC transport system substrate-binding protein
MVRAQLASHGFTEGREFVLVTVPDPIPAAGIDVSWFERGARAVLATRPDVILSTGTEETRRLGRLTSVVPIVFFQVGDPVGSGLVASMSRPGANIAGVSNRFTDLVGKRLEILRELKPGMRRAGILLNGALDSPISRREFAASADRLGLEAVEITVPAGLGNEAFARLCADAKVDGIFDGRAVADPGLAETATAMLRARVPAIHTRHEIVESGGLISLGARFEDQLKSAVTIVASILRGASPATIPVDQLSKVHLAVNLATARAMGIAVPESILVRADQVIG